MNTWEDLLGRIGQSPLPLLALFATTHTRQTTQCRGMRSKFSPLHLTTWSCACVNRSSPFVTNPLSSTTKNPRIYCVSRLVSSDLCYCIFMVYFSLDYCLHFVSCLNSVLFVYFVFVNLVFPLPVWYVYFSSDCLMME